MFFGGWLYPDAPSTGVAGAAAAFNEIAFSADNFDCAVTGTEVAQATSAPITRQFKAFRTRISFLSFNPPAKTDSQQYSLALSNPLRDVIGQELQNGKAQEGDVLGFVKYAHAASELFDEAVARNGPTHH
jgi:hypothetical protein